MRCLKTMICLTLVVAALTGPVTVARQTLAPDGPPADAKRLAKDKRDAFLARQKDLIRAQLDAAHVEYESRMNECLAGRCGLDILLGSLRRVLSAEQALSAHQVDRIAALERYWMSARILERLHFKSHELGRASTEVYLRPKHDLLEAEIWLVQNGGPNAKPIAAVGRGLGVNDVSSAKEMAGARAALRHADLGELMHARAEAGRGGFDAHWQEFVKGRGCLDILLSDLLRWLDSERAMHGDRADRVAFATRRFEIMVLTNAINQRRYEAHRIAIQDYLQVQFEMLDAELEMLHARLQEKKDPSKSLVGPQRFRFMLPADQKEVAKAKRLAAQDDLKQLLKDRLDAARGEFDARNKEFIAGRGTLDIFIGSSQRLLRSEQAIQNEPRARLAALDRYWVRMKLIEDRLTRVYEQGRVPRKDVEQVRYYRLDAERQLLEARGMEKPK